MLFSSNKKKKHWILPILQQHNLNIIAEKKNIIAEMYPSQLRQQLTPTPYMCLYPAFTGCEYISNKSACCVFS